MWCALIPFKTFPTESTYHHVVNLDNKKILPLTRIEVPFAFHHESGSVKRVGGGGGICESIECDRWSDGEVVDGDGSQGGRRRRYHQR